MQIPCGTLKRYTTNAEIGESKLSDGTTNLHARHHRRNKHPPLPVPLEVWRLRQWRRAHKTLNAIELRWWQHKLWRW